MPVPIDLVQQGAALDLVQLLDDMLARPAQNTTIFQSNEMLRRNLPQPRVLTNQLDDFVRSPSPLPGGQNEFSEPTPFVSQNRLVPNRFGGVTLSTERPQDSTELDLLESLSAGAVSDVTSQSASDLATFGARTDDPFGTPRVDNVRSILRRLVDRV